MKIIALLVLLCNGCLVQCFLVGLPDDRNTHFFVNLNCSDNSEGQAILRCIYNGPSIPSINFKQVICAGRTVPVTQVENGYDVQAMYYPGQPTTDSDCIFMGPVEDVFDLQPMYRYTVYLSWLWSDGYPGWMQINCYRTFQGEPEGGNVIQDDGSTPEPDECTTHGGTSTPGSGTSTGSGGTGTPGTGSTGTPGTGSTGTPGTGSTGTPGTGGTGTPGTGTSTGSGGTSTIGTPGSGTIQPGGGGYPIVGFSAACSNVDEGNGDILYSSMHLITDIYMSAFAYCYNNTKIDFVSDDTVNYFLKVYYDEQHYHDGKCVFEKAFGETYSIRIEVSWGERGDHVHTFTKNYIVSCVFDDFAQKASGTLSVTPGLTNLKDVSGSTGIDAVSVISLHAVTVLEDPIQEPTIPLGRTIMLKAVTDGGGGEVGLVPLSCDAIGQYSHQRYAILRAGCGDGIIFPKSRGFITNGLNSLSPYFTTFALSTDTRLTFQCNFTLCATPCDGSTCRERRRRSSRTLATVTRVLDSVHEIP